jgi:predicted nucleotidyltransferase
MITKDKVDNLVAFINKEIRKKLGKKLDCAYLIGSYAQGKFSLSRPDINWLLIHKDPVEDESRWVLGEILTNAIDKFLDDFTVRPELRPFKFSYPLKRGEDVFVNLSIVTNAPTPEEFKKKNHFLPEYVFEGYKVGRRLLFGEDVLGKITFQVDKPSILASAMEKILDHKIQLDRVPLVYHLTKDIDLVFNEALTHGKNLVYFGVELVMSNQELKEKRFLEYFQDKEKLIGIYQERLPEAFNLVRDIFEARDNYEPWKKDKEKAKKIYLTASGFANLLMSSFMQGIFNEK